MRRMGIAAHVVIEGIDKRRRDVYQQIQHAGQAKAYAATPDQERQAYVFEQVSRSYMTQHPECIRRFRWPGTGRRCCT